VPICAEATACGVGSHSNWRPARGFQAGQQPLTYALDPRRMRLALALGAWAADQEEEPEERPRLVTLALVHARAVVIHRRPPVAARPARR
jgi:hypothetical protein